MRGPVNGPVDERKWGEDATGGAGVEFLSVLFFAICVLTVSDRKINLFKELYFYLSHRSQDRSPTVSPESEIRKKFSDSRAERGSFCGKFCQEKYLSNSSKQHTHTSHHHHCAQQTRTHTQQSATNESVHPPKEKGSAQRKGPGVGAPRTQKGEGGRGRKPSWGCWLLRGCRSQQHAPVTHRQTGR